MSSTTTLVFFVLVCRAVRPGFAWGPVGHGLVARLAQSQLTVAANSWINDYMPDNAFNNLSAIASWPDLILYPDTNPIDYKQWQWSRELHFINTPDWACHYEPARDCVDDRCIEGALTNYSRRFIDGNCDYVEQQEALFFLVHFLGDVHQPLHSGFKSDFGGNSVKGYFLNGINLTNLHSIWDVEIIDTRIRRHFQSDVNLYYEHLQSLMVNETANNFRPWIDESVNYVCTQVYFDGNNRTLNASAIFNLGDEYFNRNWPLVDQRLAQAGSRLAGLLNQLSTNRSPMKLTPGLQALIITLSIALGLAVLLTIGLGTYLFSRKYTKRFDVLPTE